jgi:hypothetical protein
MDEQFSAISLRDASKPALKTWAEENTRDTIIAALGSIDGVAYASATAGQKNTWLTNNADRVLFGAAKANTVAGDHASSLANVDATNDILNKVAIDLMKRMASHLLAEDPAGEGPGQRQALLHRLRPPLRLPRPSRDLEGTCWTTPRRAGQAAKLFEGGDLMFRGVIIKELLDMPVYTGVGAASIDVAPVYLLGAQAIGYAIAKRWKTEDQGVRLRRQVRHRHRRRSTASPSCASARTPRSTPPRRRTTAWSPATSPRSPTRPSLP